MKLHAEPLLWRLRLFDDASGGYAQREPYAAIVTVVLMGKRAWISGMHGHIDRSGRQAINDWLRSKGVKVAEMERHGETVEREVL